MNANDILTAVNAGEDKDWEFKSAKGGLPGSMWETYSAMANTDGGVIVLGIKENDGDFEVQGLDDPGKSEKDFWTTINNRGKISANQRLQQFGTDIVRLLQDLVGKGFLVKDGYGRWASYRLIERLAGSRHSEEGTPATTPEDSSHSGTTPVIAGKALTGVPEEDPALPGIADPARKQKRLDPDEMRRLIRSLCQGRFLIFRRQLATLLGRGAERPSTLDVSSDDRNRSGGLGRPLDGEAALIAFVGGAVHDLEDDLADRHSFFDFDVERTDVPDFELQRAAGEVLVAGLVAEPGVYGRSGDVDADPQTGEATLAFNTSS